MRASHKKRIGRLVAALDAAEKQAIQRRCNLALEAAIYGDIRAAMEWRGIDPRYAWGLRRIEPGRAKLAGPPELEAVDAAWLAAHRPPANEDPWEWLADELWRIGQRYLDGSQPDFSYDPLIELWAWALVQPRLLPAIPCAGYGVSVNTS